MPKFGPIHRRDLIAALRKAGFEGTYAGGNHEFMVKGQLRLFIPNPHGGEISRDLLARILKQANIRRSEFEEI